VRFDIDGKSTRRSLQKGVASVQKGARPIGIFAPMPTTEEVKERIEEALPGAEATVTDLTGGGDHLRAEVVYEGFVGLSRIEQHKLVYNVFEGEIGGPIHALSLQTSTRGNDR
jgi:stress-induced morphogen